MQFCVRRVSMSKTVPLQAIQFNLSTQFKCKYSLILKKNIFQGIDRPYQMLPFRAIVDLGAMAMKGCFAFPKLQNHCNLTIRLFSVISGHSVWGSYPSAEVQMVYSTGLADWALLSDIYFCQLRIIWTLVYGFKYSM